LTTFGSSKILDVNVKLSEVISGAAFKTWSVNFQTWPKDLEIRRNMTTSIWHDISDLVASNEAQVLDGEAAVGLETAAPQLKEAGLAYRFAVVVGADERMMLQLQMLPASAATLMGRPTFRG
jgi:hypothetical protein